MSKPIPENIFTLFSAFHSIRTTRSDVFLKNIWKQEGKFEVLRAL